MVLHRLAYLLKDHAFQAQVVLRIDHYLQAQSSIKEQE